MFCYILPRRPDKTKLRLTLVLSYFAAALPPEKGAIGKHVSHPEFQGMEVLATDLIENLDVARDNLRLTDDYALDGHNATSVGSSDKSKHIVQRLDRP